MDSISHTPNFIPPPPAPRMARRLLVTQASRIAQTPCLGDLAAQSPYEVKAFFSRPMELRSQISEEIFLTTKEPVILILGILPTLPRDDHQTA
jgi:hypothetical protein